MKRIIHNTTYIVNNNIEKDWVQFIINNYIPPLKKYNECKDILFTKVSIDQAEGSTYSIQIVFEDEKVRKNFIEEVISPLEKKLSATYNDSYLTFDSVLSEIL